MWLESGTETHTVLVVVEPFPVRCCWRRNGIVFTSTNRRWLLLTLLLLVLVLVHEMSRFGLQIATMYFDIFEIIAVRVVISASLSTDKMPNREGFRCRQIFDGWQISGSIHVPHLLLLCVYRAPRWSKDCWFGVALLPCEIVKRSTSDGSLLVRCSLLENSMIKIWVICNDMDGRLNNSHAIKVVFRIPTRGVTLR